MFASLKIVVNPLKMNQDTCETPNVNDIREEFKNRYQQGTPDINLFNVEHQYNETIEEPSEEKEQDNILYLPPFKPKELVNLYALLNKKKQADFTKWLNNQQNTVCVCPTPGNYYHYPVYVNINEICQCGSDTCKVNESIYKQRVDEEISSFFNESYFEAPQECKKRKCK